MVASTSRRKAISFTLLSIMLPISLLATFRITGIISEPPALQTKTLEPVIGTYTRPSDVKRIESWVNNTFSSEGVYIELSVRAHAYWENQYFGLYGSWDALDFCVHANVSVTEGSISQIMVKYHPLDANAMILIDRTFLWERNVTVTTMKQTGTNSSDACIIAQALSRQCALFAMNNWLFVEENEEDHRLQVTLEVTYLDEVTRKKTVLPVILEMLTPTQSIGG